MTYPIFVSFYCGKQYYYDAAKMLIEDCRKLDIPYDIEELQLPEGADWAFICRKKTEFYARKLEEHKQPIFWLDVDTRVLRKPKVFENAQFDFAAFLRNFKYLRDYDPVQFARTYHPGFLYFNYTDGARALAGKVATLEATQQKNGTDDFFLQEAWLHLKEELEIMLLPPKRIRLQANDPVTESDAWFYFGESGNVKSFAGKVEQHEASIFDKKRQYKVLKTIVQQDVMKSRLTSASVLLKKMVEIDPDQDEAVHTLGRVMRRQKNLGEAIEFYEERASYIKSISNTEQRLGEFYTGYFDFLLDSTELDGAATVLRELSSSSEEKFRHIAQNRTFRLSLELRARQIGKEKRRLKLWWMEQPYPGNFGDIVNPYIVEKLSGIPPKLSPAGNGTLAIGSVIKFAKKGTIVWGSGSPRLTDKLAADADYRAVRGPLTRRLVLDSGGNCEPVYGDAALLLPFIYRPKTKRQHKMGFIKHFTHKEEPINLASYVREIDIIRCGYEQIEQFLDELWECDFIVSTSLHGIIVCHAYGIPVVWATFASEEKPIPGGDVKFADYFASVGLRGIKPLNLSVLDRLDDRIKLQATSIITDPDYEKLLSVAPFEVTLKIPSLNRRRVIADMLDQPDQRTRVTVSHEIP
jgi:tetratricopeptide (TPR) repeat protein